jgi:hypothetical protein
MLIASFIYFIRKGVLVVWNVCVCYPFITSDASNLEIEFFWKVGIRLSDNIPVGHNANHGCKDVKCTQVSQLPLTVNLAGKRSTRITTTGIYSALQPSRTEHTVQNGLASTPVYISSTTSVQVQQRHCRNLQNLR